MFLYQIADFFSDPNLFTIGSFEVKKYAFCIMVGALLAFILGLKWAKHLGISEDIIYTGFCLGLITGVLGSRIFYCFYYEFDRLIEAPWIIFSEFRNGGLAIYGAILGAGLFVFCYCLYIKISPIFIGELVAPGFLIGQACGRWGNFFNKEAHGQETTREALSWLPDFIVNNMYIDGKYWQPTFLYESFMNLICLVIILSLRKWWKKYLVGDGLCIYCMWYGILRFIIEIYRTDALTGNIFKTVKVAQVLGIILFVAGLAGFILRRVFHYKNVLWCDPDFTKIQNSFGKVKAKAN